MLAAKLTAVSFAESPVRRRSACRRSHIEAPRNPPRNRIIGYAVSQTVPLARECVWDRTPLGLESATPCQPRAALAGEGPEKHGGIFDLEGSTAAPRG